MKILTLADGIDFRYATNIAAVNRHHARDSGRPLTLLALTQDFAGALGAVRPNRPTNGSRAAATGACKSSLKHA